MPRGLVTGRFHRTAAGIAAIVSLGAFGAALQKLQTWQHLHLTVRSHRQPSKRQKQSHHCPNQSHCPIDALRIQNVQTISPSIAASVVPLQTWFWSSSSPIHDICIQSSRSYRSRMKSKTRCPERECPDPRTRKRWTSRRQGRIQFLRLKEAKPRPLRVLALAVNWGPGSA
jgi:hypothetical protein